MYFSVDKKYTHEQLATYIHVDEIIVVGLNLHCIVLQEPQNLAANLRLHLVQVPTTKTANLNWCAHTEVQQIPAPLQSTCPGPIPQTVVK